MGNECASKGANVCVESDLEYSSTQSKAVPKKDRNFAFTPPSFYAHEK